MTTLSRRNFFFASSGAAAGSLLVPGLAAADEGEKLDFSTSGLTTGSQRGHYHQVPQAVLHGAL